MRSHFTKAWLAKRSSFAKDGSLNKRYGKFIFLLGLCFHFFDTLDQMNNLRHILAVQLCYLNRMRNITITCFPLTTNTYVHDPGEHSWTPIASKLIKSLNFTVLSDFYRHQNDFISSFLNEFQMKGLGNLVPLSIRKTLSSITI